MTTTETKPNIVTVGAWQYEPEVLGTHTEPLAGFAIDELASYAREKWGYSEEKERFEPSTTKERREFAIFDSFYYQFKAILMADKNSAIESVQELFDLARSNPAGFEELYQAAITANPGLEKETSKADGGS